MEVTKKCKETFEKYLTKESILEDNHRFNPGIFNRLPESMKYGVLVDFFDSVGIYITEGSGRFMSERAHYFYWVIKVKGEKGQHEEMDINTTRKEARENSIEKANKLYNASTRKKI